MNVLCSVMRAHFIQMARSIGIVFAFGVKRIPMPLLSMRDSPKVNIFYVISKNHVHGPFFFERNDTGYIYLQMLQNWLMDELIANKHEDFHFSTG